MEYLHAGEKFSFTQETVEAIHLRSPIGGGSLGYHAPADEKRDLYKPELLGASIFLSNADVLVVERAYKSILDKWNIVAIWNDYEIQFNQEDVPVKKID